VENALSSVRAVWFGTIPETQDKNRRTIQTRVDLENFNRKSRSFSLRLIWLRLDREASPHYPRSIQAGEFTLVSLGP
jgi:hypothetical protein